MTHTITILGSTGSIGRQTLQVARELGLSVAALTANRQVDLLEQQARRALCGGCFARVLWGLERGQPLQDAWEDGFRELTPPEAAGILRDTELTGDEERIVSALTSAACRLDRLADTRRRDRRQQERLLWTAALSGAGLFIILLM